MHGFESAAGKPMLARLGLEVLQEQVDLSSAEICGERHEDIGTAQVTVVFQDFILKNQVVPECIPGQIRQDPVILVSVIAEMREDDFRFEAGLNLLEPLLNRWPFARKVALTK